MVPGVGALVAITSEYAERSRPLGSEHSMLSNMSKRKYFVARQMVSFMEMKDDANLTECMFP